MAIVFAVRPLGTDQYFVLCQHILYILSFHYLRLYLYVICDKNFVFSNTSVIVLFLVGVFGVAHSFTRYSSSLVSDRLTLCVIVVRVLYVRTFMFCVCILVVVVVVFIGHLTN